MNIFVLVYAYACVSVYQLFTYKKSYLPAVAETGDSMVNPEGRVSIESFVKYVTSTIFMNMIWATGAKLLVSENAWKTFIDWFGDFDDMWIMVFGSVVIHAVLYYGMNFTFLYFHNHGIFKQYQLPRGKGQPFPDETRLRQTILEGSLGIIFTMPVSMIVLWKIMKYFGSTMASPLPTWNCIVFELTVVTIMIITIFFLGLIFAIQICPGLLCS